MSVLLGIDTATVAVSVALVSDGELLGAYEAGDARHQTEVLHPAIARLLDDAGVAPSDLDAIVVDRGPGRFTGVRVGLAAAKALAFAVGVGVVGLESTDILLSAASERSTDAVAVVDLRRGEVAVRFANDDPSGLLRMTPADLGRALRDRGGSATLLCGDGAIEYEAAIAASTGTGVELARDLIAPSALDACRLAERCGTPVDPIALAAVYLRGADVRVGWATRSGAVAREHLEVEVSALGRLFHRGRAGSGFEIVPMTRRHVNELLEIERQIFPRPWTANLYYSELAQPESRIYLVATLDGEVIGYIGCMFILDEGHITTVGVAPELHRRGIATRLLHTLATAAIERHANALSLEVRMSNHGAQNLYRAFGFAPAGIRKNYYPEVNEDALVMWAGDVDTAAYRDRIDALLAKVEQTGLERRSGAADDA